MSNAADDTKRDLAQIHAAICDAALLHPTVVLLAMLDELIDVACGTNPHLKDVMKLQFYRRMHLRLVRLGVVPQRAGRDTDAG